MDTDIYGKKLPQCIPQKVHDEVVGEIKKGNAMVPYSHWLAAGQYIMVLERQIANLKDQIRKKQLSDRVIRRFLWKPVSEGGSAYYQGNPVVLVDLEDVQVVANGEQLKDHGPSNGRGTTARSLKKCSQFTAPVTVEFYEKDGRRIATKKGDIEIVEDPCKRKEYS